MLKKEVPALSAKVNPKASTWTQSLQFWVWLLCGIHLKAGSVFSLSVRGGLELGLSEPTGVPMKSL